MPLNAQVQIQVDSCPRAWELFQSMDGVDAVAEDLNREATKVIQRNLNLLPPEATDADILLAFHRMGREMVPHLARHVKYGAMDTEPRSHFADLCCDALTRACGQVPEEMRSNQNI